MGGELPLYGVSTLEAMALSLGAYSGYVCAVMDARRSQVYNALFYVNHGELTRVTEDRAIALSDLAAELKNLKEPIFLVGDGSILCYNTLRKEIPNLIPAPEHHQHQRASGVALAAAEMAAQGLEPSGAEVVPNYLRLSQAERDRAEKLKISN